MEYPMNTTTDHLACNMVIDILINHNVTHVVVSPGSRNAPLIVAVSRERQLKKYIVVDERSAAFTALGLAQQLAQPVALICTSGSAVLNYAPAIAEAYYQQIPLIVISADRPLEWIDQNDGQTIRQSNILAPITKKRFNIPAHYDNDVTKWYINRCVNDIALAAEEYPKGPVHINIELNEPLCGTMQYEPHERIIENMPLQQTISANALQDITNTINSTKKVMILAGYINDDCEELGNVLEGFAKLPNVVVMTETIANLKGSRFLPTIDRAITAIPYKERAEYAPDLVISIGGALISRMVKQYLRKYPAREQWRVANDNLVIDNLMHLSKHIKMQPLAFFGQIEAQIKPNHSDYAAKWATLKDIAAERHADYIGQAPWCDLKAFSIIMPSIPKRINLQLSNGTSIRYAQLFDNQTCRKSNCNRGVAGIDGCTSTALGASLACGKDTVLITGDMSLSYDLNGLATQYNSQHFKIIVVCNGGGGIFRFIKGPSDLDELDDYFEVHRELPVEGYAQTFGFDFYEANDELSLQKALPQLFASHNPAILAVRTPGKVNAEVLRGYFKYMKSK